MDLHFQRAEQKSLEGSKKSRAGPGGSGQGWKSKILHMKTEMRGKMKLSLMAYLQRVVRIVVGGSWLQGLRKSPQSQYLGLVRMWGSDVLLLVCGVSPSGVKILSAYLPWDNVSMYLFVQLLTELSKNQQVINSLGRSYGKDATKKYYLRNFSHSVLAILVFFLLLKQCKFVHFLVSSHFMFSLFSFQSVCMFIPPNLYMTHSFTLGDIFVQCYLFQETFLDSLLKLPYYILFSYHALFFFVFIICILACFFLLIASLTQKYNLCKGIVPSVRVYCLIHCLIHNAFDNPDVHAVSIQ